ncbi:MAG: diacylglycerol kinase family lipid kinase [Cytophagales bacterium]|nr:MAG: diacylglycerol kinase family lipid kinase [Cytophagales bacterium]
MDLKILFIVNPVSGGKTKESIPEVIKNNFIDYKFEIFFTNHIGHATEITKKGILEGFNLFIAVGGDGTVNEIAKCLINTNLKIGIIPFGSGNGLARHNKIPVDLLKSIQNIKENYSIKIDTCTLNNEPFINMAGVGFDAHIGSLFGKDKKRGFKSYIKTTILEFKTYISQEYKIKINDKTFIQKAFLVSFANSSQYGNNAFISPEAVINDGKLNVTIIKPFGIFGLFDIAIRLFMKNIHHSSNVLTFETAKEIEIERKNKDVFHLDGEPYQGDKNLKISIIPESLELIVPKEIAIKNKYNSTFTQLQNA